jgi:hypothetical protein
MNEIATIEGQANTLEWVGALADQGYDYEGPLGSGGFSEVVAVRRVADDRPFAAKLLRSDEAAGVAALKREFRALSVIRHRNVVAYHGLWTLGGKTGLVMERVRGGPLDGDWRGSVPAMAESGEPLSTYDASTAAFADQLTARERQKAIVEEHRLEAFLPYLRQLVEALGFLHARGIVHGDIKPSNVLVEPDGRVVLVDFGLFRLREDPRIGGARGHTPGYAAPELPVSGPSVAADWYAVGRLCARCLSGSVAAEMQPGAGAGAVGRSVLDAIAKLADPDSDARLEAAGTLVDALGVARARWARADTFVGREAELDDLQQWIATPTTQGHLALIEAPSGIGKSSLLRALAQRHARSGGLVVHATCHAREQLHNASLDAVVDALARVTDRGDVEPTGVSPLDHAAALRVFPALAAHIVVDPEVREIVGDDLESRDLRVVAQVARQLCCERDVLVALDDIQWFDRVSMDSSFHVLRQLGGVRPRVVAAYRTDASSATRSAEWWRARASHDLQLEPLDDASIREVATNAGAAAADLETIVRASHGNPFFARILATTLEDGLARAEAGPATRDQIDAAIRRRAGCLPPAERELVQTLALCGAEVDRRIVESALERSVEDVEIVSAVEGGLVRVHAGPQDDLLELVHDRVREAIRAGLPPEALRDGHLALARGGEATQLMGDADLGAHLLAGDRLVEGAERLESAGRDAALKGRTSEAGRLLRRAHEAHHRAGTRAPGPLLRELAEVCERLNDIDGAIDAYEELALSPVHEERSRGLRRVPELRCSRGEDLDPATAFRAAFEANGIRYPGAGVWTLLAAIRERSRIKSPSITDASQLTGQKDGPISERAQTWASAFISIVQQDFIRAVYLHNRYLRAAEESADQVQVAVAYAVEASVSVNARSAVKAGRRRSSSGPLAPATTSSCGSLVEKKRFSAMRGPERTSDGSVEMATTFRPSTVVSS